MEYLPDKM